MSLYTVAIRDLDVAQGEPLPPVISREGEQLMRHIIEFMYFGQLESLEMQQGPFSEETHDVLTRLLIWCSPTFAPGTVATCTE
jgi:hypothetical protein